MVQIKNFSESLEKDLQRLNVEIEARKREGSPVLLTERDIVKRSFEHISERTSAPAGIAAPHAASPVPPARQSPLPSYLQKGDYADEVRREVTRLVEYAFSGGLAGAIKESKRHSAFVQDAFHDALVDKLLPELKRRGML